MTDQELEVQVESEANQYIPFLWMRSAWTFVL